MTQCSVRSYGPQGYRWFSRGPVQIHVFASRPANAVFGGLLPLGVRHLPRDDRKSTVEKAFGSKDDARSVVRRPFDRIWRQGTTSGRTASYLGPDDVTDVPRAHDASDVSGLDQLSTDAGVSRANDPRVSRALRARRISPLDARTLGSGATRRLLRRVRQLHAGARWDLSQVRDLRSDDRMLLMSSISELLVSQTRFA